MTHLNKLDLDHFFFNVKDQIYVIVKYENFPNYYKGSDIDVFCYNKDEFAQKILEVGNSYLDQGFEIKVTNKNESHTYIDFFLNDELEFRFDLYQSLPEYKKIRLKQHYIFSVIENAVAVKRDFNGTQYSIYVPSKVDELLLRYVEYVELYEIRPDKIKHLDYILNSVSADSSRIGFIDKLHLYTELPEPKYDTKPRRKTLPGIVRYIKRPRALVMSILGRFISKFPFLKKVYDYNDFSEY